MRAATLLPRRDTALIMPLCVCRRRVPTKSVMKRLLSLLPVSLLPVCRLAAIPVTLRSLGLGCITTYFLFGPPAPAFDVVARYLGYGMGLLLFYVLLGGAFARWRVLKTAPITLIPRTADGGRFVAGRPVRIAVNATIGRQPPFFRLSILPTWPSDDVTHPQPEFRASLGGEYNAEFSVILPHRGEWQLSEYQATSRDLFGLVCYQWRARLSHPVSLTVYPPDAIEKDLPITSSRRTTGEAEVAETVREGEPFDLKRYDPSDGLRRIVWKIFARTGQLVARYPEPTAQPEGKTLVYVIADRLEDQVAAHAYSYLSRAAALGLEMRCGCIGMNKASLAQTPHDSLRLLLESVWRVRPMHLTDDIQDLLEALSLESADSSEQQVAIFVSARRFVNLGEVAQLTAAYRVLSSRGIKPIWYIVRDTQSPRASAESRLVHVPAVSAVRGIGAWWFFDTRRPPSIVPSGEEESRRLAATIYQLGGAAVNV